MVNGLRPFTLRPLCVARDLGWCDHDYPRCGGHTSDSSVTKLPVLDTPASLIGSELSVCLAPALRFAPPRCRRGCLMYTSATSLPVLYIRNIIPDDIGSPSGSLAYRGGAMQEFFAHTLWAC